MKPEVWVTAVVTVLGVFFAGGIGALIMVPAQRRKLAATGTLEITQAATLHAAELRSDLERLRQQVNELTAELEAEAIKRRAAEDGRWAAEQRLQRWLAEQGHPPLPIGTPPPETPPGPPGTGRP